MNNKHITPILVIGVSGATWDVLTPLIASGRTPNIAALLKRGTGARLASVRATGDKHYRPQVAWPSIATGHLPDHHGMTRFFHEAAEIRVPTLWDIYAREGLSSGIYGWPGTWPPPEIQGYVVPSHLARDGRAWPPDLRAVRALDREQQTLDREGGVFGRVLAPGTGAATLASHGLSVSTLLKLARVAPTGLFGDPIHRRLLLRQAKLEVSADVFLSLYWKYRPQFAAFVTFYVDFVSHRFWRYRDPEKFDPSEPSDPLFRDAVDDSYVALDKVVGRLTAALPKDAAVALLSEHGMDPEPNSAEVGRWNYFIRGSRVRALAALDPTLQPVPIARWIAFRPVAARDRELVAQKLRDIRVVEIDLPLFRVYKHDDEVVIKFALDPDVPRYARGDLETLNVRFGDQRMRFSEITRRSGRQRSAMHAKDGVFILSGAGVRKGAWLPEASIIDVAPTLLAVACLRQKDQFDGRRLNVLA